MKKEYVAPELKICDFKTEKVMEGFISETDTPFQPLKFIRIMTE